MVGVDIYIKDTSVSALPISGVVASIYDVTTLALLATATSDVTGKAAFSLSGAVSPGTSYEVRFYKAGVLFANPVAIRVIEPTVTTNKFDVVGAVQALPVSIDPRICRCTGQFLDFGNRPMAGRVVRVMASMETGFQVPKLVDGNMVAPDSMEFRTDSNGKVSIDLYRSGEFYITFAGDDDTVWNFKVPDRSSANLIDLIHPQPVSITWDQTAAPGNAISVAVGQTKTIPFTSLFSNYEEIDTGLDKWFTALNSDDTLISAFFVRSSTDSVQVTGVAPGSAQVTWQLKSGLYPIMVPPRAVVAEPLVVTVTP